MQHPAARSASAGIRTQPYLKHQHYPENPIRGLTVREGVSYYTTARESVNPQQPESHLSRRSSKSEDGSTGIKRKQFRPDMSPQHYYHYHYNALGSIVALSDTEGKTIETYHYDIYGKALILDATRRPLTESALQNHYLFTGRRLDTETGMYYYRARIYSPDMGRFLQTDPVGYADGINWYSYCGNNPNNFVDPTGQWFWVDDLVASAVGAVVGVASQIVSDVIAGGPSSWESYVGSAVGGAVAAETFLYTANPVAAGAAGGAAGSVTRQGLEIAFGEKELSDFSILEVAFETGAGAAFGKLPGARIQGVTAGRGSAGAVTKQIITKFQRDQISKASGKTLTKMATYYAAENLTGSALAKAGIEGNIRLWGGIVNGGCK